MMTFPLLDDGVNHFDCIEDTHVILDNKRCQQELNYQCEHHHTDDDSAVYVEFFEGFVWVHEVLYIALQEIQFIFNLDYLKVC